MLAVIDFQEKLAAAIHDREVTENNIERLIRGCHLLTLPALYTEQYPQGLGPTTARLRAAIAETYGSQAVQKMCFSGFGSPEFAQALKRPQVLLAGIETHVCVFQTAMDVLREGFEVHLVADAVSSRTAENKRLALERMKDEGVKLTTTEMALFELTERAGTDEFRAISRLVK